MNGDDTTPDEHAFDMLCAAAIESADSAIVLYMMLQVQGYLGQGTQGDRNSPYITVYREPHDRRNGAHVAAATTERSAAREFAKDRLRSRPWIYWMWLAKNGKETKGI